MSAQTSPNQEAAQQPARESRKIHHEVAIRALKSGFVPVEILDQDGNTGVLYVAHGSISSVREPDPEEVQQGTEDASFKVGAFIWLKGEESAYAVRQDAIDIVQYVGIARNYVK